MSNGRTALVLSGGGMFGAYQAGAYRAISRYVKPDIVVGASVGALNGWLIAGGRPAEQIVERWLDARAGDSLRMRPKSRSGRFDRGPLRELATDLVREYTPRIPTGVIFVEVRRLQTRLAVSPGIRPEHLVATCSVPLFFPTVKIDGRRAIDGGFLERLPVWAAVEMGASRVIAIDALPQVLPWWMRAGVSAARIFAPRRKYAAKVDLTVIGPSERLGDMIDAVRWKRENIERWIDLGARDAENALSRWADRAA
jgi:predicted acylesterase/phospholipase RssA